MADDNTDYPELGDLSDTVKDVGYQAKTPRSITRSKSTEAAFDPDDMNDEFNLSSLDGIDAPAGGDPDNDTMATIADLEDLPGGVPEKDDNGEIFSAGNDDLQSELDNLEKLIGELDGPGGEDDTNPPDAIPADSPSTSDAPDQPVDNGDDFGLPEQAEVPPVEQPEDAVNFDNDEAEKYDADGTAPPAPGGNRPSFDPDAMNALFKLGFHDEAEAGVQASEHSALTLAEALKGKSVVLTGKPPKDPKTGAQLTKNQVAQALKTQYHVAEVSPIFTSKTQVVVYEIRTTDTAKLQKAKQAHLMTLPYEAVLKF